MIKSAFITVALTVLMVCAAVPVSAHDEDTDLERLKEARGHVIARSAGNRPGQMSHLDYRRRQLDRLIDALEDGKRVDPVQIDRLLGRQNR